MKGLVKSAFIAMTVVALASACSGNKTETTETTGESTMSADSSTMSADSTMMSGDSATMMSGDSAQ
jgi:hypothetical protein